MFNRSPILPWFMISLAILGVVVAVTGILVGALDPFRAKPSQVTKAVENGYLAAMGFLLAVAIGFLAFWSTVEGIKATRPSALASQETKATVAPGSRIYSYAFDESAWSKFLCRALGICHSYVPRVN